jgi:hypothetical protein
LALSSIIMAKYLVQKNNHGQVMFCHVGASHT